MKKDRHTAPKNRSGWILLLVVVALYAILAFSHPQATYRALLSAGDVLGMMLPILLVVMFLMALLNTFIQPKKIAKYLGGKSGLKGWFIAVVSGIVSHGPGYVWYPILSDLRQHGVRDGLIVTFIYARAIKIPWLPMMIAYFGTRFTFVFLFYILLGALLQGMIMEKLTPKTPILPLKPKNLEV